MASSNDKIELEIKIPFSTERLAVIAYDVLKVDAEPIRNKVTKTYSVEDNYLKAYFSAETTKQVRVAVTNFFDNIVLILKTMEFGGTPVSETYSYY